MKLTQEQIDSARADAEWNAKTREDSDTVTHLALAYQRVEALLDPKHSWDDEDNDCRTITVATVRRAPYGEE